MTTTFNAVYENGVLRPIEPIDLPDRCEVKVEVREIQSRSEKPNLDDVYAILDQRFASGEHDVAARHNEHQP